MKWLPLILLLLVPGCGGSRPRQSMGLTAAQAGLLARQLANDEAQAQYHCRPFQAGPSARVEGGRWVWRDRQAYGQGDLEARVSFAADGSGRTVQILLLDNRNREGRL